MSADTQDRELFGLRAEEWQELCRACENIYISSPTPPYFRGLLLAGLREELEALRAKVRSFGPAQLEEAARRARKQQAEQYPWLGR